MSKIICSIVLNKIVPLYLLNYTCCTVEPCTTSNPAGKCLVLGSLCLQGLEDMKSLVGFCAACTGVKVKYPFLALNSGTVLGRKPNK